MRRQITALCFFVALLCVLAPGAGAAQPSTGPATRGAGPSMTAGPVQIKNLPQNVLAHGTDELYWVAHVVSQPNLTPPGEQTQIFLRRAGGDTWQHLSDLPTRATCLADMGSQLAVLLSGGDWLLIAEDGSGTTGQYLPGGAQPVTLASDGETLWAVAATPAVAATQPASAQPATLPAAPESPSRLVLYMLKEGEWKIADGAAIPADLRADAPVSLAIIDRVPWLAILRGDTVGVLRQTPENWRPVSQFTAPPAPAAFKLLSGIAPPVLWLGGIQSGRLEFLPSPGPARSASLKETDAPITDRTAVFAINSIREIAIVEGKLTEQSYDRQTMLPTGKPATIALPRPSAQYFSNELWKLAMTLALAFAIFSSARRRRDPEEAAEEVKGLALAEAGRRLAAGLIDMTPFVVPLVFLLQITRLAGSDLQDPSPAVRDLWLLTLKTGMAAFAVYLLHTTIVETLTGRTLGKMLMGLRVVRLDGGTPDVSSLVIRNFLRLVDVGPFGLPLMMILFSPLHQRIGDIAGGTVVIRDRVRPEGNLVEPAKEEPPLTPAVEAKPPAPAGD
ncbi:MAG TPA: RDD family protein [Tepidisphaeraceae bacterium]|nr:RDD family protein [Tepidisphaeraceae bacterium]